MADVPASSPVKAAKGGLSALKGLPKWAYVVIGGGVLIVALYFRHQQAKTANDAANNPSDSTGTDPGQFVDNSGYLSPYNDPSLYGAYGGQGGFLPNGTGAATNPSDSTGGTPTSTSDSHDITTTYSPSDSHDLTGGDTTNAPTSSISTGDVNAPFFGAPITGGGAPNRPNTHTPPKHHKPKPPKHHKPPKKKHKNTNTVHK